MAYYAIIRGPLGVGRSTIAAALAQSLDANVYSVDAALHELEFGRNGVDISEASFLQTMHHLAGLARTTMAQGKIVIFDGNFYYASQITILEQELGKPRAVITLEALLSVCIQRDAGRLANHGQLAATAIYSLVRRIKIGTSIDTAGKTTDTVVSEALRVMESSATEGVSGAIR